jgi:hypothetical protein
MPISGQVQTAIDNRVPSSDRIKRSDETAEILGYTCHKYTFEEKEGPVEIWATDQLGQFVAMPQGNRMQPAPAQESWDQFIQGDFFPMRIISLNHSGKERMHWEVTPVTPEKRSPVLFTVPAGFRKFDMGAMMQGLGGPPRQLKDYQGRTISVSSAPASQKRANRQMWVGLYAQLFHHQGRSETTSAYRPHPPHHVPPPALGTPSSSSAALPPGAGHHPSAPRRHLPINLGPASQTPPSPT